MRLLHTSDWHLGQTLLGFDRDYEQRRFLAWLADQVEALAADALLVAGDVFDTTNPSADAQRLLYHFLADLRRRVPHLAVVLIAGNHDSGGRLEAPSPLLDAFGIHVVGHLPRDADGAIDVAKLVLPLRNPEGEVGAWCLAVPFLRPGDLPRDEEAPDYAAGVARLYRAALAHAETLRAPHQPVIAMGHCHMAGGQTSELSERRIVIGGAEALPTATFDPAIAYAALGHLHRAQRLGEAGTVRYCGSPLPLSFAEVNYHHQVLCLELEGGELARVEPVPVPRFVELLRVPADGAGPLAQVLATLEALDLPERPMEQRPYLEVRVRLEAPEPGLRRQVETALAEQPVRLAKIETRYGAATPGEAPEATAEDLERLQPEDLFRRLYAQRFEQEPEPALLDAFGELLHEEPGA